MFITPIVVRISVGNWPSTKQTMIAGFVFFILKFTDAILFKFLSRNVSAFFLFQTSTY
jgi:hypothetical protein